MRYGKNLNGLNMKLKRGSFLQGGKYKIEAVLGQGSFGITYLATAKFSTDGGLGKMEVVAKVAIKEFFMSELNSRNEDGSTVEGSSGSIFSNYRRKFRKEAKNLAKLSHSNIVRVFDVFDENGTLYYVMEYLDGENLDEYIKSQGRLEEEEAIKIIKEVGAALSYMHSKKMLHLDMKPKNIMHRKDSGNSLIDFGLSKQYTEDGEPESSTSIGLGTPGYAPLEQAQYSQDGTFPATLDVYALGATMFKMLTGKRPPEATVILNIGFPYKELRDLNISDNTITALAKSMHPIKKDRWPDVKSFIGNFAGGDEESTLYEDNGFIPNDIYSESDGVINDPQYPNTLSSIWKSRNILTNWICIIGLLITLIEINNISAHTNYGSEITLFFGLMSVLVGIVAIMYGKKTILYAPLLILPLCGYIQLHSPGGCMSYLIQSLGISIGYAGVVGSLFLKHNGVRAIAYMDTRRNGNKQKWNKAVSVFTYFATTVLIIAIPCLISNFHIGYYRFGSLELLEILFCAILILMKLRMGVYLLSVIILLGYFQNWINFSSDFYNIVVENCVSILFAMELAALFFIKKDGKTAWSVME